MAVEWEKTALTGSSMQMLFIIFGVALISFAIGYVVNHYAVIHI